MSVVFHCIGQLLLFQAAGGAGCTLILGGGRLASTHMLLLLLQCTLWLPCLGARMPCMRLPCKLG